MEFGDEVWTYARLDAYSNQVANVLIARGVKPGDLVAVYLLKSPRLYGVMLGILKAGAAYVPIDPRFPIDRIRSILEDSDARAIVTESPLSTNLDAIETPVLDLGSTAVQSQSAKSVTRNGRLGPENLCYVIYTSGSTGRPKGVMVEHRNAVAFVKSLRTIYRISEDDRIYQGFSTAFDASVEEIWAAFSIGGTLVVPSADVERSPADAAEFIAAQGVTYFSTVPTMLSMIDRDLPSVRTLVLGGEACSNELVTRWARDGRRMLNTYGPTEATVVATWAECIPGEEVTIGGPLPGYTAYVLDETLQMVRPGESGELYIGGAGVARGYRNLPDLTDERFISNPFDDSGTDRLYKTHDLVRLGEDGQLYFLGRLDDQIKIRGFRIELSEIEAVLIQHPAIKAAAVRVVETTGMKELAAYVVCDEHAELDRRALSTMLRDRMPAYMVPQFLDVLPELPMLPSGKINRKSLPAPQHLLADLDVIEPPADELERQIANAWQQTLGLPEVSVLSDFFLDLGGHSLTAAQTATLTRKATGSNCISVRDLYALRTVRALAEHIRATDPGVAAASCEQSTPQVNAITGSVRGTTPSIEAHRLMRMLTACVQGIAIIGYYGLVAAPLAYLTLMITSVLDGHIDWVTAAEITTLVGFAIWPVMLILSIAIKWLVIGRYKPGRYPIGGAYYLRWWIASRFQPLGWSKLFIGTPLMPLYWRAMGARIGRNVTISTPYCTAFDVVTIGDDTSVGLETQVLGYRVEDGHLLIAPVSIGRDCFVGMHCALGLSTVMGDGSRLDDMSLLPDGMIAGAGESLRGVPAVRAEVDVPKTASRSQMQAPARPSAASERALFGLAHFSLFYVMSWVLMAASMPSVAMILGALYLGGPLWGIAAAFAAIPVGMGVYLLCAVTVKQVVGHQPPATISLWSAAYLRHWFLSYLLDNTKWILMPVYGTMYSSWLLRALGAKIGRGAEISTVTHVSPDSLEVGDGSFLADACLVGGERVHNGLVEIGAVRIGARSFIGNSALIPGGRTIGEDVLIGVASTPPANTTSVVDNTRWLGSPGFALPTKQTNFCFGDDKIFTPSRAALVERGLIDAARILVPGVIGVLCGVILVACLVMAFRTLPLAWVIAATPLVATGIAILSVLLTAAIKWLVTGRHRPSVHPLWSRFVWRNEFVNGVYESVAASAMLPLMGTPFIAPCLRAMGCKVGRGCFLETTLFSEFDLVEIGDRACLNLGSTVQTHLFEDRIFKSDRLRIGDGCTVANMSVVLYGAEMKPGSALGPMSVLMKGETLPEATSWHGIPCEPAGPRAITVAAQPARERRPSRSPALIEALPCYR